MKDRELIRYEETDEGLLLFLKVHAKAKKNGITGVLDGRIKVSITQAPQKAKSQHRHPQVVGEGAGAETNPITTDCWSNLASENAADRKSDVRGNRFQARKTDSFDKRKPVGDAITPESWRESGEIGLQ